MISYSDQTYQKQEKHNQIINGYILAIQTNYLYILQRTSESLAFSALQQAFKWLYLHTNSFPGRTYRLRAM